ncbi:Protein PHOTOPERIOD-INDEPENDENT EARLY FLOWERING like [Actinidia chinensis var. chinensis]|uniref:DNA helicase n=1 Tax=Actinidia chinensis var. chinensis TaxID=1590841 RepID=A0A2R6QRT4_ACTCC|nr:Protein PHOTOPERIOD-INDEPENDENT EARLY FLOWERING like [Actinidia chinensis var. chinensis]
MASKGPRSKLDHETRARRQKPLEASKEPRRPKTHWDHVLEEMVWLSKDFESERKWKLAQAKKVAIRASKGMLDPATRGEKKVKEEEQRLRKVALNISKDVKKFWIKIEKLVLYKHQLELDEKKKKALDKQLEFLLGQTERYSTMLAENLVNSPISSKPIHSSAAAHEQLTIQHEGGDENESQLDVANMDEDFDVRSEDESEDDEHTIEEDEALITEEERQEELAALHNEVDLPLEELLKRYAIDKVSRESSPELNVHAADEPTQAEEHNSERKSDGIFFVSKIDRGNSLTVPGRRCGESNGSVSISEDHTAEVEAHEIGNLSKSSQESYKKHIQYDFHDEQEDGDFVLDTGEEKDDETTLLEEEELAKAESNEPIDEVELLQKESEIPLEELLARYKKEYDTDDDVEDDSQSAYTSASGDFSDYAAQEDIDSKQQHVPMEADDNPSEVQPVVDPIIEEEVEPDIKLEGGRANRRLIQFDCGKLQELSVLLRRLKSEGHRALIFTQMTKMLDILEAFINLYGYTYMRLDGSTQPEERQTLMQRFNTNPKIFLFILSTRSGGVGINLVGADTVIFYDSDWNPAMDQQAQDRCHRIGQTREVHIYRLISQSTIEENILRKANQKRALDDLVIQSGGYNTEFFKKLDPMELFSGHQTGPTKNMQKEKNCTHANEVSVSNADVEAALKYAEDEADYMALKKVEQEEAVENQEFTEEVIGRLEDDEFINEDEMKVDESADPNSLITTLNKEKGAVLNESDINEDRALTFVAKEDDVDMLADVKQMAAAAAAAGQAILSFESQLRPIDRYAIRFLELWDPIIDKTTMESEVRFEESEWELDRIEKLKEDMEAEIDDDEEPFVYEKWDADFATEAYRQEVEALAQHQLLEDLACEAKEEEHADHEYSDSAKNDVSTVSRPKSKKKPKKAKFKSLKKGTLASESKAVKKELPNDSLSIDDENTSHEATTSSEVAPLHSTVEKKRKAALDCDEVKSTKKSKKVKKAHPEILAADSNQLSRQLVEPKNSKLCESVVDLEQKPVSRSKMGGKISITPMPVKRVLTIKPEKFKKKGNIWSRDCLPSPDFWMPEEDAMLCVLVHEYGPHWSLVSETLYGMTAGGLYRGRYRHPVHCCERFRELIQRYVLSAADNPNNEKAGNAGSGKALLKVTEDNIRVLLDVATELPDSEALLQKHFFALLSSIWRMTSRLDRRQSLPSSRNGFYAGGRHYDSMVGQIDLNCTREPSEKMEFTNLSQCSKLVAAALCDANSVHRDDGFSALKQKEEASAVGDWLEITLELQRERDDSMIALPSVINLLISGKDTTPSASMPADANQHLRSSQSMAENRFRTASRDCTESSSSWASSAFQTGDVKYRTASKSQTLGKHKLSICEPVKPSKSKARKTALDLASDIITPPIADLQPMITLPINSIMSFDLTPPVISDVGIDAFESSFPLDMDEYWLDSQGFDLVPHDYVPGFISGLDDYSSLPKFTDIG